MCTTSTSKLPWISREIWHYYLVRHRSPVFRQPVTRSGSSSCNTSPSPSPSPNTLFSAASVWTFWPVWKFEGHAPFELPEPLDGGGAAASDTDCLDDPCYSVDEHPEHR